MAGELDDPVIVDFPLRGEGWMPVTTPAARIPSHGTDMLGQRFAYDFVKVDTRPGVHVHPAGTARATLLGVPAQECYAWGAPVHSPVDGEVVVSVDGVPERTWIHPVSELSRLAWNAWTFTPDKLPAILGNHVVLRFDGIYAAFAHLAPSSVAATVGQRVRVGDRIGRVGHTGNSTSPHLHFQVMDSLDLMTARGIACAFRAYEVDESGSWIRVEHGIPGPRERLRSVDEN